VEDSLTYLTIKPGSRERIVLEVKTQELVADKIAEAEMFRFLNQEREKIGLTKLVWEPEIVPVARAHATDMWERRYFGHVSPEGEDVGDRLDKAGVNYGFAGENLALAPTISTAHIGLMNSEGHRANILESKFKKVGVGVIDNGVYGKMFVQVFTN
ncbi:MAG: CAP domain-containing protein, partial [Microgenomates group bacterium]